MVLILFTPIGDTTKVLTMSDALTAFPVPDISFSRDDLIGFFDSLIFKEETLSTATQYGVEHIFYLEKSQHLEDPVRMADGVEARVSCELHELKPENLMLRAEFAALRASWSWRITAPIRSLKASLMRAFNRNS
jgi:hypothetical protein